MRGFHGLGLSLVSDSSLDSRYTAVVLSPDHDTSGVLGSWQPLELSLICMSSRRITTLAAFGIISTQMLRDEMQGSTLYHVDIDLNPVRINDPGKSTSYPSVPCNPIVEARIYLSSGISKDIPINRRV